MYIIKREGEEVNLMIKDVYNKILSIVGFASIY